MLNLAEVPPGIDYSTGGFTPTGASNTNGDTRFSTQTVDDHIKALLGLGGLASGQTNVFTGNVYFGGITGGAVYPPGSKILAALQDAADAEFPGVAVIYVDKAGVFTFHGRLARFNPSAYGFSTWNVGDMAYRISHGSGAIPIRSMTFDRTVDDIVNAALYTPQGIANNAVAGTQTGAFTTAGQLVADSTSITAYGVRGLTGTDNYTGAGTGDGLTALQENQNFGHYWVDNRKNPLTYAKQITVTGVPAGVSYATDVWNMLCNVEIGDEVVIHTTHPSSGGFGGLIHFVEGISYDAKTGVKYPGDAEATLVDITMTLDLSPAAYYTTKPTGW
jgi:hypothetical protein